MIDDSLIAPYERLAASRAEMAEAEGVSVRTLRRRLAAQRERAAERYGNLSDIPWVELVHGQQPDTPNYDTACDRLEKPPGPFWIGTRRGRKLQIQHAGNGKPVEQPQKSKAKFKPKQPKRKRA